MTRWRIVVGLALLAVLAGMVALYHPGRNPVLGTVALGRGSYMLVVDARSARAACPRLQPWGVSKWNVIAAVW
jgi:hypothetical protein